MAVGSSPLTVAVAGCLAFLVAGSVACTRHTERADNLLLITLDTTRADHLSAYGYPLPTSPVLDALAARGALFEQARSHVASTLPSHTSIMTGKLPPSHGVRWNGVVKVPSSETTLAEILAANGFQTGAVIGAFPLERRFGLAAGFTDYDDRFEENAGPDTPRSWLPGGMWEGNQVQHFQRRAADVTDRALGWLKGRQKRWFLFAHYFDPHHGYEAPPDIKGFPHPYDAEIAYADREIGRLLAAVQKMPGDTLIVVTADHGEGLGDHDEPMHSRFVYDTTIHVPLIFVLKGKIPAGRRITEPVTHVDLLPTVLELLALPVPEGLDGASLVPALARGESIGGRPQYMESLAYSLKEDRTVTGIAEGDWKFIHTTTKETSTDELYNLRGDPREIRNVASLQPERTQALAARLADWSSRLASRGTASSPLTLDRDAIERLKALGYLDDR